MLRSFLKNMLLYTGGPLIGRILTLILLPFMTKHLTPADYGIIAILNLIPLCLTSVLSLGFQTSLGKIYAQAGSPKAKEGVICSAFAALLANNGVWILFCLAARAEICLLLFGSPANSALVVLSLISAAVSAVRFPFEYYLRAAEGSKSAFCLRLLEIGVSLSAVCMLVIFYKRGAQGYMEAALISQACNLGAVLCVLGGQLHLSLDKKAVKELIWVGLPCIYGYFGYCILQGAGRYLLQLFATESEVGLFFLGSNMGRLIELPLWGFMSAWVPFFHEKLARSEAQAAPLFSKIMSYYLLGMSCFCAALFCSARPLLYWLLQPPFQDVWRFVGVAAVSQALWGAYAITSPALIHYRKTALQALLELGAGGVCIAASAALVPLYAGGGAALATLCAFIWLIFMSIRINQRVLYTPYEWQRIGKIAAGLSCVAALSFLPIEETQVYSLFMLVALGLFFWFCWSSILTEEERRKITFKNTASHAPLR
jgi:O-antigen/teichoic acid export membrane protein